MRVWELILYPLFLSKNKYINNTNSIDSNTPITPPTEVKEYVIINYLPADSANYDGVNKKCILEYFKGGYVLREG